MLLIKDDAPMHRKLLLQCKYGSCRNGISNFSEEDNIWQRTGNVLHLENPNRSENYPMSLPFDLNLVGTP